MDTRGATVALEAAHISDPGGAQRPTVHSVPPPAAEAKWDLAFLGLLIYLVVEYTRLPAMFPALGPFQLGKVAVAICGLGFIFFSARSSDRLGLNRMDAALFLFVIASLLAACFAQSQDQAWDGFFDIVRWAVIYFLLGRILTSRWRLRVFVFLLLLLNLKLAQFAIRSYFFEKAFGRSEVFLSVRGVGGGSTGFFGNAGDFGVAMCVVLPLAAALALGERRRLLRLLLLVSAAAFLGAILVCGSRGALLGSAVAASVAWLKTPRRFLALAFPLAIFLAFFYLLPEANKQRLRSATDWQDDPTASIRIRLWKAGLRMFRDHPLLGVGPRNFGPTYALHYAQEDPDTTPPEWVPHSIYVQALSELGLLGAVPVTMLGLLFWRLNVRTRKHLTALGPAGRRSFEYYLATGLELAMVGYLISGAFLTVLFYPHFWILLGVSVGLYTAVRRQHELVGSKSGNRKTSLVPVLG